MSDWLGEAAPSTVDVGTALARDENTAKAKEFAQQYLVFMQDPRAKALLGHWEEQMLRKKVRPSASLQEYAHAEGMREFVQQIRDQIKLANS